MSDTELLSMYTDKMKKPLGPFFHHLWQDLAHLHLSWNEYLPLFGKTQARFDTMNKAAPGFFTMVHDMWWNDIILMLWRLTDSDKQTLSILRLEGLVRVGLRDELRPKVEHAVAACKFAHEVRNLMIAHRNADVAMKVAPKAESSRADIKNAIAALDAIFDFVHNAYTDQRQMIWDHLDTLGGSEYLLWIVRRGLKARDDDFENHKMPMRFPD